MNDKNIILERLNKRDVERIDKLHKSQKAKEDIKSTDEQDEYFGNVYQEKSAHIDALLSEVPNLCPDTIPTHFSEVKKEINDLQKYFATSSLFLKEFNMRKYSKMLHDLQNRCYSLEEKFAPRKKFGFSRKKILQSNAPNSDSHKESDTIDTVTRPKIVEDCFFGFESRINEILVLTASDLNDRDVTLRNLKNCVINLSGLLGTLHMNNLSNCLIVTGPVNTSVFVNNCVNIKIAVICQQLRMHSSKKVEVYLHVTCKGVIEDCNDIKFAPYTYDYDGLSQHLKRSTLDIKINNWDKIDDFNWLSPNCPSPHWSLIDTPRRIKDWTKLVNQLPVEIMS